jgi:hypothetical protein
LLDALARQYLAARGHEIGGANTFVRRQSADKMSSWSAIPITAIDERLRIQYSSEIN